MIESRLVIAWAWEAEHRGKVIRCWRKLWSVMVMFITLIGGEFHECIKMSKHIKLCNLNMCRFLSVNYTIELREKIMGSIY